MTYGTRKCIPFLMHIRNNTTGTYTWTKSYGTGSNIFSLWWMALPKTLSVRDVIHVRAGLKEGSDGQGMKLYITSPHNTFASATLYATITLASPGDFSNKDDFPVTEGKLAVDSTLATAAANGAAFRSWVGPADTSSSGTGYMHGLVAWVEKVG